jgi:hypothetical protein
MKASMIIVTILLIISSIFCGILLANLNITKDELRITKTQLATIQAQLDATKNELTNTKTRLSLTESQLGDTQVKLTYTEIELQTAVTQLTTTEEQLETTNHQLEMANNERNQMLSDYSSLSAQIYLRQGEKEDSQKFITPDNPIVSTQALKITGGYSEAVNERWSDYKRLYDWVTKNIEYSSDSYSPILPQILGGELKWIKDFWRMPEETLEDEAGDCEDMAVLLASMMLSYNKQGYAVWAIAISNKDSGHLGVAFPVVGDKLAILDPAGNYYTGYLSGWFQSYDVDKAVSDWLSHWTQKIPGAKISYVFSNKIYKEFDDSQEFINWVKE